MRIEMSLLFKIAEEVRTLKEQTDEMKQARQNYNKQRDEYLRFKTQENRTLCFEVGTKEHEKFRKATNDTYSKFDRAKRDRKNTLNRLNTLATKL